MAHRETLRESDVPGPSTSSSVPGAAIVFANEQPTLQCLPLSPATLVIGRDTFDFDVRLSREHARIEWRDGAFWVSDLGSRNGTRVNGERITDTTRCPAPAIVRVGRTLIVLLDDVSHLVDAAVEMCDSVVVGPRLASAWQQVERVARSGGPLMLTGESGTGKELAAQLFHRTASASGRLVSVNCAAVPAGLAERLLFGAKRGAYSGADADADGYVAGAHGGTLFLDEVAELDSTVQGKLLRVLETSELWPLGASKPRTVSFRLVAATLQSLRDAVAAGRFREDLYFRVGQPEVRIPALRERLEEIPWLIVQAISDTHLSAHVSFVEACLLRNWPGNVRELLREVRRAATAAGDDGSEQLRCADLSQLAGMAIASSPVAAIPQEARGSSIPAELPADSVLEAALRAHEGNVSRTAMALNLHRNQVRRWLARNPEIAAWARAQREKA